MSESHESVKSDGEEEKKSPPSSPASEGLEAPEVPQEEDKRKLVEMRAAGKNTFFCYEDDREISDLGLFAVVQAGPNRVEQLDDVTDIVGQEGDESFGLMFIHRYPNGHIRFFVCSSSGGLSVTQNISLNGLQRLNGRNRKRFVFKEGDKVEQLLKDSFDQAKADISTDTKVESFGVDAKEVSKLGQESSGIVILNRSDALNFQNDIKAITGATHSLKTSAGEFKKEVTKVSKQLNKQDSKFGDLEKKMANMEKSVNKFGGKLEKLQKSVDSIEKWLATEDGESGVDETKSITPRAGGRLKRLKGETSPQVIYCCKTCRSPEQQCRCQPGQQFTQHGGYGGYGVPPPGYYPQHYGSFQ